MISSSARTAARVTRWLSDLRPHLVIGDLDSAEKGQLRKLSRCGSCNRTISPRQERNRPRTRHQHAVEFDPNRSSSSPRSAAASTKPSPTLPSSPTPDFPTFDVRLDDGVEEILLCRDQVQVHGRSGDIVSLIPWGGSGHGVQTQDLKWPLNDETLYPEKTRGISNEMISRYSNHPNQIGLASHRSSPSIMNCKSTNHERFP